MLLTSAYSTDAECRDAGEDGGESQWHLDTKKWRIPHQTANRRMLSTGTECHTRDETMNGEHLHTGIGGHIGSLIALSES